MRAKGRANLTLPAWAGIVLLFTIACVLLNAQTAGTGALTGTITDSSGAVIPNVQVVLTSSETGQARTANTNAAGVYYFSLLPPGAYRVRISATGFRSVDIPNIQIAVTETPVLDRALDVGTQAESVLVEANVQTVQTASSTLGTVVPGQTATALPLTTRNYTNLLGLSAGAVASVGNAISLGKGGMEVATNGGTVNQNNFSIDGINTQGGTGTVNQGFYLGFAIPNPDMLQEFKIQTSLYDAGYGRNPGANFNVVTKSGTNSLHGTAFEFFRNMDLNATDFFRNRICGNPANAAVACRNGVKQVLNQNQFGGTVGGPIKKDKFFFFAAYQQTWQKNGAASQGYSGGITLPPIPNGDRGITDMSGNNDAAASAFQRALGAAFCRSATNPGALQPGGGMQVACDGSNISPVALRYLQVKLPNGQYYIPGSGAAGNLSNISFTQPAHEQEYQGMGNLDYQISAKHTISSRYFISREPQIVPFSGGAPGLATPLPGDPGNSFYGYQTGVIKLTSILGSSLVNEVHGSVLRSVTDQTQAEDKGIWANSVYPTCAAGASILQSNTLSSGVQCVPQGHGLIGGRSPLLPNLSFQGLFLAFGGNNDVFHHATTPGIGDQLSLTKGAHTMRFGGDFEAMRWVWVGSWLSHGVLAFQTFSDFLIGLPGACGSAVLPGVDPSRPLGCNGAAYSNVTNTNNFDVASAASGLVHNYRWKNGSWFVQDDWRLTSRLTLNIGLRWEYDGRLSDKYGNLTSLWPSAIGTANRPSEIGTSPANGVYNGWVVPSNYSSNIWGRPPAGVINSGRKIGTSPVPLTDFAPRLGFAWRPFDTNRFVVRGGGGFFYDRVPLNTEVHSVEESPPYGFKLDQGASTNQFSSLARPFQDWKIGTFQTRWLDFANNRGSDITEPTLGDLFLTPLVYSWNLNFQYEFEPSWVLEFGYVGSKGIHLAQWIHMINEPAIASPSHPVNGVTVNAVQDSLGNYLTNARLRAPLLGMSVTGYQLADTIGDMKFNSAQATLRKVLSHGLTFQASYTFSRAFTTQNGPGGGALPSSGGLNASSGGPNLGDPLNLRQQYGPAGWYRPHRMVINYNWEIPGKNLKGVARAILGGWSLSGVTTIQSGQWLSVTDTRGGAIYGMAGAPTVVLSRAQMAPGMTYEQIVTPGNIGQRLGADGGPGYLNKAAFTTIPSLDPTIPASVGAAWGNSGVGIIEGPGQFNFDTTLAKNTRVGGIHEDAALQFRAEFFNLFNHAQFGNPVNNMALPTFGSIQSTSVNPRLVQLALKYIF
jgi:hypothetical protein